MGGRHRRGDTTVVAAGFNLATRDYRHERRQRLLAGAAAIFLLLLLAVQVWYWAALRQKDAAIADQLSVKERELLRHQDDVRAIRAGFTGDAVKRYEAKVAALNSVLEAAAFSWSGLLTELERSVPPGVALAEISPDTRTGRVALHGAARTFADLGRFLRGLEQRTAFAEVFLLRQAARRPTAGGPETLEFSIVLTYRGRDS